MKKLAIIGCGGIGGYHLGHFLQFTDIVELAGFCDLIPERAENFQKKAGTGKAYTDYRVMLDEVKPDMVFVCIPPYCHGQIEFDLIERGIHFFVEKPLALELDLARKIRDAAEAKGLITASGFQCRYSNLVEPNKQFVANNQVVMIECSRIGGVPDQPWWRHKDLSGGQAAEQTIHQFDIIRYMIGDPEEVFSFANRGYISDEEWPGYDTDDLSTTVVKFKNGILATISTGCYATSGNSFDSKITFSTRDKRAELKILDTFKMYGEKPAEPEEGKDGFVIKGDGALSASGDAIVYRQDGDAGILCDRTFIEAVISGDGSKIRSPYADAFKSVSFTLACNESMATGKPVKVELE
ncbi:MAG: Gfo/Idh/MocA family oxidoreductase [Eubacteriales bacterium]|nr:Gfo/Idh/MocA family oxidoreductase [Clostridiales bacterium]MDD7773122.1 Gfo/Idh/MocA family oxidoreductase [Eubacteriales bacterium]MDY3941222.1 Gfo/Idh/MocA family oxidoreductase [Eubacteriales bacterium]